MRLLRWTIFIVVMGVLVAPGVERCLEAPHIIVRIDLGGAVVEKRRAALDGLDQGTTFAEGHMLDAKSAAMVAPGEIGRLLTPREARRMIERFEAPLQRPTLRTASRSTA
jgi:hypothetical protein